MSENIGSINFVSGESKNVQWSVWSMFSDFLNTKSQIETDKRFKRKLFISTKHNMRILEAIPFIQQQNDT